MARIATHLDTLATTYRGAPYSAPSPSGYAEGAMSYTSPGWSSAAGEEGSPPSDAGVEEPHPERFEVLGVAGRDHELVCLRDGRDERIVKRGRAGTG